MLIKSQESSSTKTIGLSNKKLRKNSVESTNYTDSGLINKTRRVESKV